MLTLTLPLKPRAALSFDRVPFDLYLPSAMSSLKKRICRACGIYNVSAAACKRHTLAVHENVNVIDPNDSEEEDGSDVEQESDVEDDDGADHTEGNCVPKITNLTKWMSSQWEDVPKVLRVCVCACVHV